MNSFLNTNLLVILGVILFVGIYLLEVFEKVELQEFRGINHEEYKQDWLEPFFCTAEYHTEILLF